MVELAEKTGKADAEHAAVVASLAPKEERLDAQIAALTEQRDTPQAAVTALKNAASQA